VTRRPDERFHQDCLLPKFKNLPHTMVWGSFAGAHKGPLIIWDRERWGTVKAASYIEYIFPLVRDFYYQYCGVLYPIFGTFDAIFQQDNAPAHRAKQVQQALEADKITTMDWPANSPDLNLIENIWKLIKDRLDCRMPRPSRRHELIDAI